LLARSAQFLARLTLKVSLTVKTLIMPALTLSICLALITLAALNVSLGTTALCK
jgi:hypothetical protein